MTQSAQTAPCLQKRSASLYVTLTHSLVSQHQNHDFQRLSKVYDGHVKVIEQEVKQIHGTNIHKHVSQFDKHIYPQSCKRKPIGLELNNSVSMEKCDVGIVYEHMSLPLGRKLVYHTQKTTRTLIYAACVIHLLNLTHILPNFTPHSHSQPSQFNLISIHFSTKSFK